MSIADWLIIDTKSGEGNKVVDVVAKKNTGEDRTTVITVSGNGFTKTVNCIQAGADRYALSVSASTYNSAGGIISNIGQCSIGDNYAGGVSSSSYFKDTQVTVSAKAAPTGYNFTGWYEGSNLVSSSLKYTFSITATRQLVAKYTIQSFVITATSENTNHGTVEPARQTIDYGKSASVRATTKQGYTFDGWYENNSKVSSTETYTFAAIKNRNLTAKWTINSSSTPIKIEPAGSGVINPNPLVGQYGTKVTCVASANSGYSFKHWLVKGQTFTGESKQFTCGVDTDITAVFEQNSYIIRFVKEGDISTLSKESQFVPHGGTIECEATPIADSAEWDITFHGWYTGANRTGEKLTPNTTLTKTNITASATYYANADKVKRRYVITANVQSGKGTVEGGGTYDYGTNVALIPKPAEGYRFVKWSDNNTDNPRNIVVNGNTTYSAIFKADSYLNLSTTELIFEAAGGTKYIDVTSNVNWTVS